MNPDVWLSDKRGVVDEARRVLACAEVVYLDTETTGLGLDDEVVQREVKTEIEDRMYRVRIYVRREARPRWQSSELPQGNDSSGGCGAA